MREIKFRAWDKVYKRMVYSLTPMFDENENALDMSWIKDYDGDYELMQFTGLHDENNVPIYEGDIVPSLYNNKPCVVVWDQGCCEFRTENDGYSEHLYDTTGEFDFGRNMWEVIGNIYENPELLEGK